ncbi:MAG: hypothetical protein RL291_297, partial [Pseudomonadota bacterium]
MPASLPAIEVVEELGSTNTELMERLARGVTPIERLPLWLRAERQTAGRGRQGRAWQSKPGNLAASLAIRLSAPPDRVHQLSMVAGLAVHDCVSAFLGGTAARVALKWPNDVLVDGSKISGILCETTSVPGSIRVAIIGIGINLAHHPDTLDRPTTSIAAIAGAAPAPDTALDHLSRALMLRLAQWDDGQGFATTRHAWLAIGHAMGEPLTVHRNAPNEGATGPLTGRFAGLDADGALLL